MTCLFLRLCISKSLAVARYAYVFCYTSSKKYPAQVASVIFLQFLRALFNSKNGYIFVAAFKAFTEFGHEDSEFGKFLEWFVNGENETEIDGKSWNELDKNHSTRDSGVVHGKVEHLVALMGLYFKEIRKAA